MTVADVAEVEAVTDEAFHDLDARTDRTGWPEPSHRSPAASAGWRRRIEHEQRTDPGGCWVAEDDTGLLGAAVSTKRELTWVLATFAVRPRHQGRGVGRHLLEAATAYGDGCLRRMVTASDDPAALRRYRLAGLSLHPQMLLHGRVPRAALPVVEHVREGSLGDVDLMNSVDRRTRGSAHGPDHEVLLAEHRLVVLDRPSRSGYAYLADGGGSYLVAATDRRAATALLWEALAASDPEVPVSVPHVTSANEWAVDVGMAARLELRTRGYLALQGMRPPAPYLHSGHFL